LAHLLMDRVERPTESGKRARLSEVVKFVNCTELLRATKFAHLDIMLNAMIVASPYAFVFDPADISTKDIALVTEDEAAAMGRNFVSILLRVGLVPSVRLGSGSYSPVPRRRSPRGRMWPKFGSQPLQRSLTTSPPRGPAQLRARQSRTVSTGFEAAEAVSSAPRNASPRLHRRLEKILPIEFFFSARALAGDRAWEGLGLLSGSTIIDM
jgi:hypothetical protein